MTNSDSLNSPQQLSLCNNYLQAIAYSNADIPSSASTQHNSNLAMLGRNDPIIPLPARSEENTSQNHTLQELLQQLSNLTGNNGDQLFPTINGKSSFSQTGMTVNTFGNNGFSIMDGTNETQNFRGHGSDQPILAAAPVKVESFARVSALGNEDELYNVFDDDCFARGLPRQSRQPPTVHESLLGFNGGNFPRQEFETTNSRPGEVHGNFGDFTHQVPGLVDGMKNNRLVESDKSMESTEFLIPSTLIPPSVLASNSNFSSDKKRSSPSKHPAKQSSNKRQKLQKATMPQDFLESLLKKNGIPMRRISSDSAEYDTVPSVLQLASFGTHLVKAVHTGNDKLLAELLECGLSPNPCNQFRDSVIDLVCKRANTAIFNCLMDHGCDIQVTDGFGRTPLHHACWASTFCPAIIEGILMRDPIQLCIEDKHGQTPLEYVRSEMREEWIAFLEEKALLFFGSETTLKSPKDRRSQGTLIDPPNSLSVTLAAMVSSGKISPLQITQMDDEARSSFEKDSF